MKKDRELETFKKQIKKHLRYETLLMCLEELMDQGKVTMMDKGKYGEYLEDPYTTLEKKEKSELLDNPYIKNISLSRVVKNYYRLSNHRIIPRGNIVRLDEPYRDLSSPSLAQVNHFFYCDDNIRLPALSDERHLSAWMSTEPFEINSFAPFIEAAHGKVLLCGLGLGYATYMLSLKEDVESIVVVELSEDVIDLFKENILPQFEHPEKVHIVHADAIDFLKTEDLSGYDFINVDIWKGVADMLDLYFECLPIERANSGVSFYYWLEPRLKEVIQSSMLGAIVNYDADVPLFREIARFLLIGKDTDSKEAIIDAIRLDNFREEMLRWYRHKRLTSSLGEPTKGIKH